MAGMQVKDARALLKHAESLGVRFTPGHVCGGGDECLRLCFAFYSPSELVEGVRRLARALETFQGC